MGVHPFLTRYMQGINTEITRTKSELNPCYLRVISEYKANEERQNEIRSAQDRASESGHRSILDSFKKILKRLM